MNALARSGLALVWLLQASCAPTTPATFYLLTPVAESPVVNSLDGPWLGVGPVSLPGYLDRPQMVLRQANRELEVAGFHRWGEPLREHFPRVLTDNLVRLLPEARVSSYPWRGQLVPGHQLTVEVLRFDIDADGNAVLEANWELLAGEKRTLLARGREVYRESSALGDHHAQVAALSKVLETLSRRLAREAALQLKVIPPSGS
ncbi:MAG: membrane integrity-associated transporter subunit PqiC [Magnetococcales bacterium]|nr:membrane integrity-associated transporter subunit PqiC [Magnetococcales bacterium]